MTRDPRSSFRAALARTCLGLCGLALVACAPLPDIAKATAARTSPDSVTGPAPVLVPIDGILAQADALGTGAGSVAPVTARADRLRARADRLRRD